MPRGISLWKKRKFCDQHYRPMSESEVSVRPRDEAKSPSAAPRRKIREIPDISDNVGM